MFYTSRALKQLKTAPGFQTGAVLADRAWTYWTMTGWDSEESVRQYITTGSHKNAMKHLLQWCDEGSVVHWSQVESTLPSWIEADNRMRESGRPSKVRNPSPQRDDDVFRSAQSERSNYSAYLMSHVNPCGKVLVLRDTIPVIVGHSLINYA